MTEPRRRIPSVDSLLADEAFTGILDSRPRPLVLDALRRALDDTRRQLAGGTRTDVPTPSEIAAATLRILDEMERPSLRRVINATGIPLHTNLGRAPLSAAARRALVGLASGYSNLEYDLDRGARGSRHDHCAGLLREITGAEGALVVNNNAAAVVLALNELAEGREVIVSRGELVEIGGSFRVPEIIAKSGARIVEVGATNRTHAADYERAIGEGTGVLLKVHRSNFQQTGFVSEVPVERLVEIARPHGLPVLHDLGSGLLSAESLAGLPPEPDVAGSLEAGVDVITFSGDKLLGGPQAGIILGRTALVERMRRNPLLRAVRVGKLTLAALEATLQLWRDPSTARQGVPAIEMLTADASSLRRRAEELAEGLREMCPDAHIDVERDISQVGGGSYPGAEIETWVIAVRVPGRSEGDLERACRSGQTPVIGRVADGALRLDPRTVLPGEVREFIDSVAAAVARPTSGQR